MMNRCLVCYKELNKGLEYHPDCSMALFASKEPLILDYRLDQMQELAKKAVASQATVTGVQTKISLGKVTKGGIGRLSIDLQGQYILKPPTTKYPEMPESEALTMQMAQVMGLSTVPHGLIKLKDGPMAYITRRIDRVNGKKFHQEDLCQLSNRLSEDKYNSSVERVGKVIKEHASKPGLAIVDYFTLLLFSFWSWNTDMHMKNFSLIKREGEYFLCPAYDLLNVKVIVPDVTEQSGLMLNGRKKNIGKKDFDALAQNLSLSTKQRDNVYQGLCLKLEEALVLIENSFLTNKSKQIFKDELIKNSLDFVQSN